jgi:SDR family mycofactocin-dependent oxidoreductase
MGRMDGKVALITGAGRGQGRAQALTLAREGADILALDCPRPSAVIPYGLATPEDLAETAAGVEALGRRVIAVEGDVRRQEDLDALVERGIAELGQIDVCVANAGVVTLEDVWKMSEDEWTTVVDICLHGAWRTAKAVVPHMIERERGSIVFISSLAGIEGGNRLAHYTAAKHGVLGLMKSMCQELGPAYGIRVNAVLPGVVDTDIIKWPGMLDFMAGGEGLGTVELLEEGTRAWHALKGRGVIDPQITANAVLYLASDEAADVTGLELVVDGGHNILPGLNAVAMAAAAQHEPSLA